MKVNKITHWARHAVLLSLIALVLASCSRNPVTGKREVMLMSENQEISMGKSSDPQIVAQYGLYEDQRLQNFINAKGQEMARISHRPNLDYEFKILDSPVINAFAVPGGYVYFTRGILAHFNNEAEFAGVLGHEIGHITARHSAKQYSKQMLGQVLFIGGIVVSEDFRRYAQPLSQGMQLLFLKFGRDAESQSDDLGADYCTQIGYDAHEMANFFNTLKRMRQQSGQSIPDFMSTHPNPGDREVKVHEHARRYQAKFAKPSYAVNRDKYLRMIDGLIYGADPKQGFVENNRFYHPELKFQFPIPNSWKTMNSPSQVQMTPQGGDALMTLTVAQAKSSSEAARKFVSENQLRVVEESNTSVNGYPGYALITVQAANQQKRTPELRILTYFIEYGGLIYQFNGVAKSQDFNKYFNNFRNTMKNFDKLSDPDKLNRKPMRLKIQTVKRDATLKQALTELGATSAQMNDLSLLNGMELSEKVTAGMLIKTLSDTHTPNNTSTGVNNSQGRALDQQPKTNKSKGKKLIKKGN